MMLEPHSLMRGYRCPNLLGFRFRSAKHDGIGDETLRGDNAKVPLRTLTAWQGGRFRREM